MRPTPPGPRSSGDGMERRSRRRVCGPSSSGRRGWPSPVGWSTRGCSSAPMRDAPPSAGLRTACKPAPDSNAGCFKSPSQRFCLLHWQRITAIIDLKNKNAAVSRRANTWKPMQVHKPPTQRPKGRTAWEYNTTFRPFCKGRVLPFCFHALCCIRSFLLTPCRGNPARRFCFSPTSLGAQAPGTVR